MCPPKEAKREEPAPKRESVLDAVSVPKQAHIALVVHVDPQAIQNNKYVRRGEQQPPYVARRKGDTYRHLRCWGVKLSGQTTFVASDASTAIYQAKQPALPITRTTAWVETDGPTQVQLALGGPWYELTAELYSQHSEPILTETRRGC